MDVVGNYFAVGIAKKSIRNFLMKITESKVNNGVMNVMNVMNVIKPKLNCYFQIAMNHLKKL